MFGLRKKKPVEPTLASGTFSRREAAAMIASGVRHIHSNALGNTDANARATSTALKKDNVAHYDWEKTQHTKQFELRSSKQRYEAVKNLFSDKIFHIHRETREQAESILEEMFTNAFYHAFRTADGTQKYSRKKAVDLTADEKIVVTVGATKGGLYLEVTDNAGSFCFQEIADSFARCYGAANNQIEAKESGAGLGLYMIFEAATHFKVVCERGKATKISCWVSDDHAQSEKHFSFNFFQKG